MHRQQAPPATLLERSKLTQQIWTVQDCIVDYQRHNAVPDSDVSVLNTILVSVETLGTGMLNYDWADGWICEWNLTPSTIRHPDGALARCFDWMVRKHPEIMAQKPLRLLKRGFATYTDADAEVLDADSTSRCNSGLALLPVHTPSSQWT